MKLLLIVTHLLLFNNTGKLKDSVDLRIYNNSNYYIKMYVITIDKVEYSFLNIAPKSYSMLNRLPWIYNSNVNDLTIVKKKFIGHSFTVRELGSPIDNVGDKKIESGKATLILAITFHRNKLKTETRLKPE